MPHSSIVVVAGAIAAVVDEQVVVWPWPSRARIYCEAAAGASEEESSDLGTAVPADGLSALVDDTVSDWMATAYGSVPTAAEAYLALGPNTVSIYEVTERDEAVRTFTLAGNAWREELRSPWPELKAEAQGTPRWTLVSSRPGSNLKEPSIWMLPGALFGLVSGEGPGGRWDDRVELVDIAPGASLVDWAVGDDPVGMVQQSGRNTFVMDGSDHVLLPIDTGPLQLGATDRQIVLACAGPRVLDVQSSAPLARDLTRDCASEIRRVALQLRDTPVWSMTFWKWAQASRLDTHWTTGLPDPILALTTAEN